MTPYHFLCHIQSKPLLRPDQLIFLFLIPSLIKNICFIKIKNTIQFLCALIFEALGFKKHKDFNTYSYCVFKLCLFFSLTPSLLFVNLGDEKQEIYLLWPKIWKHRNNYIAVVKGLKPFINLPADQLASGGVSWEEPRLISFHVHIHCGAPVSSVLPRPVLVGGGGQELLMSLREEHRWQSQSPYL